ncbi:MAG: hypothetical protein LC650_04100 [Actinobacteria bacterium]|nr:hypothetical protein [Actinomycetota bacterium]
MTSKKSPQRKEDYGKGALSTPNKPMYTVSPLFVHHAHQDEPGYNGTYPNEKELRQMVQDFYRRGGRKAFATTDEHTGDKPSGFTEELWVDHHGRIMELAKLNPMTKSGRNRIKELESGKPVGKSWELDIKPLVDDEGKQFFSKKLVRTSFVDTPDHGTYVEHYGYDRDGVLKNAFGPYYNDDAPANLEPAYISNRFKAEVKRSFRKSCNSASNDEDADDNDNDDGDDDNNGTQKDKEEGEEDKGKVDSDSMDVDAQGGADFEPTLPTSHASSDESPKSVPPQTEPASPLPKNGGSEKGPIPSSSPDFRPSGSSPPSPESPPDHSFMSESKKVPMNQQQQQQQQQQQPQKQPPSSLAPSAAETNETEEQLRKQIEEMKRKLEMAEKMHGKVQSKMTQERLGDQSKKRSRDEADMFGLTLEDGKQGLQEIVQSMQRVRRYQGLSDDPKSALEYMRQKAKEEAEEFDKKLSEYGELVSSIIKDTNPDATEDDIKAAREAAMDIDNPLHDTLQQLVVANRNLASHSAIEKRFLAGKDVFRDGSPSASASPSPMAANKDRLRLIDQALGHSQRESRGWNTPQEQQQHWGSDQYQRLPQQQRGYGNAPQHPQKLLRSEPSDSLGMASSRASHDEAHEQKRIQELQSKYLPKRTGFVVPDSQMHEILNPMFQELQINMGGSMEPFDDPTDMNLAEKVATVSDHPFTKRLWGYLRENPSELISTDKPASGISGTVGKHFSDDTVSDWKSGLHRDGAMYGDSMKWRQELRSRSW